MTYKRFLDLKKAEAQAREAQIEAALEKVRSRTMAMHKSEELLDVIQVVSEQLYQLGFKFDHVSFGVNNQQDDYNFWVSSAHQSRPYKLHVPYLSNPMFDRARDALRQKLPFYSDTLTPAENRQWHQHVFNHADIGITEETKAYILASGYARSIAIMPTIMLIIGNYHAVPYSGEQNIVFRRFAQVFEQSYTRFLDLQKAEAQAREGQIEVALERVRSRTMAMHKSSELAETAAVLFQQLAELGNTPERVNICIINEEAGLVEVWSTEQGGHQINHSFNARLDEPTTIAKLHEGWKARKKTMIVDLSGNELEEWLKFLQSEMRIPLDHGLVRERRVHSIVFFSHGALLLTTPEPLPIETIGLLERFAAVLNLTYRRFLDLQQAEAQAREAQIESALERVRSRTMAMQHSSELNSVVATVFEELTSLDVEFIRCVIWIFNPEDRSVRWWAANPEAETGSESFHISSINHPVYHEYWRGWEARLSRHSYELSGEIKKSWNEMLFEKTEMARLPEEVKTGMRKPEKIFVNSSFNEFGLLQVSTMSPIDDAKFAIVERFGRVFEQSYTRFNDVKQAEAREQEAIKESALDRVRAEIASMRTAEDLQTITPLIWRELVTLKVPFFRCGVFIVSEAEQIVHAYLSTPEGKSLAALHLPFEGAESTRRTVAHWRKQQIYTDQWDRQQFQAWVANMVEQGQVIAGQQYDTENTPVDSLSLQFVPFKQGMLYVGSHDLLSEIQLDLVKSLADSFSVAYARYEDFKQLDQAKKSVEAALVELKSTQSQLIQSEKMASLGELTAGIAHEIQNPLNFVNNFSEVNEELLAEMNEELRMGKLEGAMALAKDALENQRKINHHGRRAETIVKSMLQHSRSSSGMKEPTDMNALTDEYLRLTYHGLRAKDKSFNAKLETDFDPMLDKADVVPQDIGRVILNLVSNAFYAVNERKKQGEQGYEPTVSVTSGKDGNIVFIQIKDNGNGMSESVKEKIFQPFFTTKPTGQGTGLGLSLSYDIVKAHGGELTVETNEGVGSKFLINLPIV